MLEKIPAGIGHALRGVRAGYDKIVSESHDFVDVPDTIALESSAFEDGQQIPARLTADGEGLSPALAWRLPFDDAAALALIVEDPDAPAPEPLVHLLVCNLPLSPAELPEGWFKSPHHPGAEDMLGRNSFRAAAWLPPDPPKGHGPHVYVFQIFALDKALAFEHRPGRSDLVKAMRGHVLAKGVLVGTYERR